MRFVYRFAVVLALSIPVGLGAGCAGSRSPVVTPGTPAESEPDLAMRNVSPGIERAAARTDDENAGTDARITMDKDGRIAMGGRELAAGRLVSALEQAGVPRDAVVRMQAHPQAPFDQVVRAVRLIREAGYARVALETDPPKTPGNSAALP